MWRSDQWAWGWDNLAQVRTEPPTSNLQPRPFFQLTPKWNDAIFTRVASKETPVELLQGTLDLIVLRALSTMGPLHAYALATRLAQVSDHPLSLNQGTLYPALVRLEQRGWIKGAWQKTENNRDAKYYAITRSGSRALTEQTERWRRFAGLVDKLLADNP